MVEHDVARNSEAAPVVPTGEATLLIGGKPLRFFLAEGREWATAADVAAFLGYSSGRRLMTLWTRYLDELEGETLLGLAVRTSTRWGPGVTQTRAVRAFSRRGVMLLALVSQTDEGRSLRSAVIREMRTPDQAPQVPAAVPARAVLAEEEAVEALKGVVDDALAQADTIRKALPKGSDARALAVDVRNSFREAAAVLSVHAGLDDAKARGRALTALAGDRDGMDRLIEAIDRRQS